MSFSGKFARSKNAYWLAFGASAMAMALSHGAAQAQDAAAPAE